MAHLVKCLLWKGEELSSIPRTHMKKAGHTVCTCNHGSSRTDNWIPGAYSSASTAFSLSSRSARNTVSRCLAPEEQPRLGLLSDLHTRTDLPTHAPGPERMRTFTCTHLHTHTNFLRDLKHNSPYCEHLLMTLIVETRLPCIREGLGEQPLRATFYPQRMDHFIRFITFHKTAGRFILFSLSHLWNHFGPFIVSYLICFFID